jgi:hypothetical protein
MKANLNEVEINGEIYVKKGSEPAGASPVTTDYYVVRTRSAGVFAGELGGDLAYEEVTGDTLHMINVRRLWYWSGAATLSQLAMEGVKKPKECKFPREVPCQYLTGVIEVIPATQAAQISIKAVPVWKA